MSEISFYLTFDHSARRRSMYLSVAVGATVGLVSELLRYDPRISLAACIVSTGIVEFVRAFKYAQPNRKTARALESIPVRRRLIWSTVSAAAVIVIAKLGIGNEAFAAERKLEQASADPSNPVNIDAAQLILKRASIAGIPIASSVLKQTGANFINAADKNPGSWEAALRFVEYKSLQNSWNVPSRAAGSTKTVPPEKIGDMFEATYMPLKTPAHPLVPSIPPNTPDVDPSKSAIFAKIGGETHIYELSPLFWIVEGEGFKIMLDDYHIRNTVIRDAELVYNGGQLTLENVGFVSCKFEMAKNQHTQELATAILAGGPSITVSL